MHNQVASHFINIQSAFSLPQQLPLIEERPGRDRRIRYQRSWGVLASFTATCWPQEGEACFFASNGLGREGGFRGTLELGTRYSAFVLGDAEGQDAAENLYSVCCCC